VPKTVKMYIFKTENFLIVMDLHRSFSRRSEVIWLHQFNYFPSQRKVICY